MHLRKRAWDESRLGKGRITKVILCDTKKLEVYPEGNGPLLTEELEDQFCVLVTLTAYDRPKESSKVRGGRPCK